MNFNLTDDQRMLQEGAARYFEKSRDLRQLLEQARSGGGFSQDAWQQFAEMGWLAAAVPEEHGGLGFGPVELALLGEEFGRHLIPEPFNACGVLPAAIIRGVATPDQQTSIFPDIAAGEALVAVAHSEPEARGCVNHVACRALLLPDGGWRLEGHKSLAVGAPVANRLLVVARTGGSIDSVDGISIFDVPAATAGVRLQAYALVDGSPAADVWLENVVLPAGALLGGEGRAAPGLQRAIDESIVLQCAEVVGGTADVLAICSDYLKTRKQFGVPIGSFQALQHRMADMAIEASQARASLHRGLQALTAGDPARCSIDASGVKAQVVKSARFVTQQGIQLHGGYGITEEYRVGHHWRRLVLNDALFGSGADHLSRYATDLRRRSS